MYEQNRKHILPMVLMWMTKPQNIVVETVNEEICHNHIENSM